MKTYTAKSSAVRAAKRIHGDDWETKVELTKVDDKWGAVEIPQEEAKADDGLLHKSTIGTPCSIVWDICEQMEGERRKDILAACTEAGIAYYTARTQIQRYREAMKEMQANDAKAA